MASLTRKQAQAAETAFDRVLTAMRAQAARSSRAALAAFDVQAALIVRRRVTGFASAGQVLTPARAAALGRQVGRAVGDLRTALLNATTASTRSIIGAISKEHTGVHVTLSKVIPEAGGVVIRVGVVDNGVAAALRKIRGGKTLAKVVGENMRAVEDGLGEYLAGATGEVLDGQALASIRRMLNGQLPVDIGGMSKARAVSASSIMRRAERLVVTESFESFRQGQAVALGESPLDMVAHWQTEKGACELCLDIAHTDVGFGKGWYPPELWPDAPHPYCRCSQGEIRMIGARSGRRQAKR